MFTLNHFIWLGIVVIYIILLLSIQKRKNIEFNKILTFLFIVCLLSEIIKIFSNLVETSEGGTVLNPADLPFHLCSIQIFFVFALKFLIKKEQTKQNLISFMAPTMLVGGIIALFIPTVGVEFTKPQVYQYFIFHGTIIFFAIYALKENIVTYTWKCFIRNLSYLGALALLVTWINSILSVTNPKVNFFYLCRPPMENLPILNLNNGWLAYFLTVVSIALLFMFMFHFIMIKINKKITTKQHINTL